MSYNFTGQNINRVNAVKQLAKGLKNENDIEVLGAFVNSFIYLVDTLKEMNDLNRRKFELEEEPV